MSLASKKPVQSGQPIPRLAEPFEPTANSTSVPRTGGAEPEEKKHKKRGLFGFGKKKSATEEIVKQLPKSEPTSAAPTRQTTTITSASSPTQNDYPQQIMPSSPARGLSSSPRLSPRLSSPAGSQIFERDVQESTVLIPNSPAIPSHIQTENYIPPVLDASSEAITDDHLDPDSVEIITHASHQPAAVTVTGAASLDGANNSGGVVSNWADELAAFAAEKDKSVVDSASNYGSFDTTDVRRLSFISFADVVQAEQQQQQQQQVGNRDSMHIAGLTSLTSVGLNRSPSPIRSPVSSAAGGPGTSPPTSKSGSVKGLEMSPVRKPLGSPTSISHGVAGGPAVSGELSIETMSQALRRTGSSDLSGVRSVPTSPI